MITRSNTIGFFSASENLYFQQDTVKKQTVSDNQLDTSKVSEPEIGAEKDTLNKNSLQLIDFSAIDSILRISEERELQIQQEAERQEAILRWRQRKVDTTEILYKQFGIAGFPLKENLGKDLFQQNFLYNIQTVKPEEKIIKQNVFIEDEVVGNNKDLYQTRTNIDKEIKPKYIPGKIQFDWITILLITSFLLLGWIRLFNKKYLISLIKATVSYKEANTLYREKNSLMERASFMVNLLFLSNVSVFVIQMKHFWKVSFGILEDQILYFMVLGALIALYVFRAITSWFIGFTFLKQKVYSEYFHNVNVFTKNTGLFLFPIVITLQFLSFQYLPFIVYTGLILSAVLYVLQIVRSFQIIIRKNVSIFYMILYLCAFEFAPFLIIYKILLSLA
ncbi:MAG: hypothetical protein C0597_10825 [Marinilabiliales bacterium]|nr:MAG: hypothetical protein C0597_10825 [Marinilabiliales bacterium]